MTLPRTITPNTLKAIIGSVAPVGLALLPLVRKRMRWKLFSLPSILLFGGLWLLEKKHKPKRPR